MRWGAGGCHRSAHRRRHTKHQQAVLPYAHGTHNAQPRYAAATPTHPWPGQSDHNSAATFSSPCEHMKPCTITPQPVCITGITQNNSSGCEFEARHTVTRGIHVSTGDTAPAKVASVSHTRHAACSGRTVSTSVQWSADMIKADLFFGRSRVRFHVPPWGSNTIARDHLA